MQTILSDPSALLAMLNREIAATSVRGMFVTMIGGQYSPKTGQVQLVNAGHLPALYQPLHGVIQEISADAPPLGVLAKTDFTTRELNLHDGALYLYTDGLIEARQRGAGELGISGLKSLIRRFGAMPGGERAWLMLNAVREAEVHDDLTLLLIDALACQRDG